MVRSSSCCTAQFAQPALLHRHNIVSRPENNFETWIKKKRPDGIFFPVAGNIAPIGCVGSTATSVAHNPFSQDPQIMTISTRIALGISAAAISLSLALAPAAFAQDKMGKDDGMKKESMSKTKKKAGMKKDDGMMKEDGMSKK